MNESIYRICLTIVCLFAPAGNACAQSIDEARAAYAEGRFIEAAEIARAIGTSESHALAADSLAIHGYYIAPEGEKAGLFRRAEELRAGGCSGSTRPTRRPVSNWLTPWAARRRWPGTLKALKEGYATKVRDAIEEALRLDPKMAAAHVSLAAWHAGAVGAGGFFAALLYGARRRERRSPISNGRSNWRLETR